MEMTENDRRFYLKPSTAPGGGLGCFARVPLREGDCLEVMGVRVAPGSAADQCTAYADRHKFCHAGRLIIPLGYAGMVNHSASPNLVRWESDGKLFLRALRDVATDEELFHTYNSAALQKMGLTV
jgi:uncharacterized protein